VPVVVAAALLAVVGVGGWSPWGAAPAPDPILITRPGWSGHGASATGAASPEEAAWLEAGRVPGARTRWEDLTRDALLDLHRLTGANGAVRAGAADRWSYAWPRDSAFAAVALARAGHRDDALRVLRFLARLRLDPEVGFEARYHLSGVGTPDDRLPQSDGAGWALWALASVEPQPGPLRLEPELEDLLDRCTDLVLRLTADGSRLPPPSPDYWEVPVSSTSLGTAAPLLAGLRASERLYRTLGRPLDAMRAGAAAHRLADAVGARFAPGYERFGWWGGREAAVTFLLPPFGPGTRRVEAALAAYEREARRPAGGLAPGAEWKDDGVSWTPETALVALSAAASGRDADAARRLDWLDAHRTAWGSLPEKVTRSGRPAGPAPLAWTAALVVLTVEELEATSPPG
jgi:GH15 family glucan-1,4-alpha-glucosidase